MTMPIELYYWPTPNGWKITIALEEMGLPYEMKYVNIGAGEQFEPSFLAISPNNRMPAIIDPDGPDGKLISVFESGAILQYLARKSGKFYGNSERERIAVDEWLMWQMGGLGPMAGQASHFRNYAPNLVEDQKLIEYGQNRYFTETGRLYGIMEKRLCESPFLAGDYSIADMACFPWVRAHEFVSQKLEDFPILKAWHDKLSCREAVVRGLEVGAELRRNQNKLSKEELEAQAKVLFRQK